MNNASTVYDAARFSPALDPLEMGGNWKQTTRKGPEKWTQRQLESRDRRL